MCHFFIGKRLHNEIRIVNCVNRTFGFHHSHVAPLEFFFLRVFDIQVVHMYKMTVNYIDFMNNEHDGSNGIKSMPGDVYVIWADKRNCHLIEHNAYVEVFIHYTR